MRETDTPGTWSYPNSPESVTKSRNNGIKMGDHGRSEYRTSRFTNIESKDIFKAGIAYDSRPYRDFMAVIIFGEECRS